MAETVSDLANILARLGPQLDEVPCVFCTVADEQLAERALPLAVASCREAEGLSLLLPVATARRLGLAVGPPMRRIVLTVHSDLHACGLTAAVAGALAEAGIPCNVVAAFHHDHLLVPAPAAERALHVLTQLSARASCGPVLEEPAR